MGGLGAIYPVRRLRCLPAQDQLVLYFVMGNCNKQEHTTIPDMIDGFSNSTLNEDMLD